MITQAKFNDYVKEFAEDVRDEIQSRIISENAIDTGRLFRTVDYDLTGGANKFKIDFDMMYYGKWVDEGTDNITPRDFYKQTIIKMANRFERYVKDKRTRSYVTIEKDIYGEIGLQISTNDTFNKTWWVVRMGGKSNMR